MSSSYFIDWTILHYLLFGLITIAGAVNLTPKNASDKFVSKEKQLIKFLLDRYDQYGRVGRPVTNTTESINVEFGLSLIQILNVDEKNQVLETNVWFKYNWVDIMLTWNKTKHDGIDSVRVPSDKVWIPDVVLYNFADPRLKEQRDALVVVDNNGGVLWMPQAILRSSCQFETTYFPFDQQICKLKFGSWSYDGTKLDLNFLGNEQKFSLADYIPGTEWEIMENFANKTELFYDCCPNTPYPDLTFYLTIKRKVAFYSFILILPCALLSLLTLVIFWVPPESPAKLVLGMNVFVAFFVLLLLLAESTPKAADSVPLIGAYFCLSMIMITFSTILSTIVANMFFRGVRINRAPYWLRTLMIDIVARIFLIRDKLIDPATEAQQRNNWAMRKMGEKNSTELKCAKVRLLDDGKEERFCNPSNEQYDQQQTIIHNNIDMERLSLMKSTLADDIRIIREIMENYRDKKAKAEAKENNLKEWKIICCVTDRLFFLLYLIINIIGIVVIFFGH